MARDTSAQSKLDGMTPSRLAALAVLQTDGPMRVGALAERARILRTCDPADHRAIRVSLSPEGGAAPPVIERLPGG